MAGELVNEVSAGGVADDVEAGRVCALGEEVLHGKNGLDERDGEGRVRYEAWCRRTLQFSSCFPLCRGARDEL